MTTATQQRAPGETGLDPVEACKRIDHPATIKAIDDVCAVVECERSPESLGDPHNDATQEPDYFEHWADPEFQRQLKDLMDSYSGDHADRT